MCVTNTLRKRPQPIAFGAGQVIVTEKVAAATAAVTPVQPRTVEETVTTCAEEKPLLASSTPVATSSRCNECSNSLQGMLLREKQSYNRKRRAPSTFPSSFEFNNSGYTSVRRSLIDVYDEVFTLCQLLNNDTVTIATSYLDQFMMKQTKFVNIQLAAITCFYVAVKLNEPTKIPPSLICELFQRALDEEADDDSSDDMDDLSTSTVATAEAIESMELQVLMTLKWNMNPPTPMMFVQQMLCSLPEEAKFTAWKNAAVNLVKAHLDVALKSQELMNVSFSTLATAALFVAVESLPPIQRSKMYKFFLKAVDMINAEDQREVINTSRIMKQLVSAYAQDTTDDETSEISTSTTKRKLVASTGEQRNIKRRLVSPSSSPIPKNLFI